MNTHIHILNNAIYKPLALTKFFAFNKISTIKLIYVKWMCITRGPNRAQENYQQTCSIFLLFTELLNF